MAAARALESRRPDRLFDDPLAAAFAGREGFAWLDGMELSRVWGGPGLYIVIRTRFFDDFLLSTCQSIGARQIVLLAAGMDARAFRINWPSQTRLYELDRPEVLAAKETVLTRAGAGGRLHRLVCRVSARVCADGRDHTSHRGRTALTGPTFSSP